ncbi:MAG TPA: peroxiredoxin [Sorangium sp.]|nr:peroxiredoxin [Sorangium sp.]
MRMKLATATVVLGVTLVFGGAGCESKKTAPAPSPPTDASSPASSARGGGRGPAVAAKSALVGAAAPDVPLPLHDGSVISLSALKGKYVVLYFYPKDDTPGCRVEAQSFRDQYDALTRAGVKVFGVSMQSATSHQVFIDKERLPFALVVDDGHIAKAFGVPVLGEFASRQTILIAPDGTVKKVWRNVSPDGHAKEVLAAVTQ